MFDIYNRLTFVPDSAMSSGAAKNTAQTGTSIDTTTYGANGITCVINVATVTDGTHTFNLYDSPDNSTFTIVASPFVQNQAAVVTSGAGNGSNTCIKIGYLGTNRYVQLRTTESGATGAVYSVLYAESLERSLPAA